MKLLILAPLLAVTIGTAHAQAKAGDAAAGQQKAATCIGCHGIAGYQASFPEIHKVPKISGQNAKYIAAALAAYAKQERKHPTMVSVASSLSDQDMADLAAFYEQQGKAGDAALPAAPAPSAEVAALLQKGICVSCHGESMSKPIDPSYPKLAGQHADYLYVALKAYQTSGNAKVGRSNGIMVAQAKPFSHKELKLLANYIASMPGELKTVPQSKFR
jgi:cytochrome c553